MSNDFVSHPQQQASSYSNKCAHQNIPAKIEPHVGIGLRWMLGCGEHSDKVPLWSQYMLQQRYVVVQTQLFALIRNAAVQLTC